MDILYEVLRAVIYTSVGAFAGYQLGVMRRGVEEIKERVMPEEEEEVSPTESEDAPRLFSDRESRIIGLVVLFLSVLTILQSAYFSQQTRNNSERDARITRCQAQFNADFANAVTLRGQYADEDRAQLNTMIFTVITAQDPAQRRKAVETWAANTKRNDLRRKQTPLPTLENRNCEDQ